MIFAASGQTVRELVDPGHTEYAARHGLYARFGVPELPRLWADLTAARIDERAFLDAVAASGPKRSAPAARPGT